MKSKQTSPGVAAVELSKHSFKIATSAWTSNGPQLTGLTWGEWGSKEVGSAPGESALIESLRTLRGSHRSVIGCLPRSQVTTRHLLLPSQSPRELKQMVTLQMQRQIPFSEGKMIFDYQILGEAPQGRSHLFLVVADEEVVSRTLAIFQKAGITPQALSFSSWGLLNWLILHRSVKESAFSLFLDVDRSDSQAEIVRGDQLYFSRSFPIGAEGLKTKESPAPFVREVSHFLNAFQKEFPESALDSALLSGVHEVLPRAKAALEKVLTCPIEPLPWKRVPFMSEPLRQLLETAPISYTSVAGLACLHRPAPNLLPERIKRRQRFMLLEKLGGRLVAMAALFLFLMGLTFHGMLQNRRHSLAHLQGELGRLEPQVSQVLSMEEELEALRRRSMEAFGLLEDIRALYEAVPSTVWITFLSIDPERLSLRGICPETAQVFTFAQSLEKSPGLEKVEVKSASQRRVREQELVDFRIDANRAVEGGAL